MQVKVMVFFKDLGESAGEERGMMDQGFRVGAVDKGEDVGVSAVVEDKERALEWASCGLSVSWERQSSDLGGGAA